MVLPYYKLMIPDWLYKHSTITKPFTAYPKYLEFLSGGRLDERLIQVELIAPNILIATDNVVVTLIVAMDTVLADSSDHDPRIGISDRTSFVGFSVLDIYNYNNVPPCFSVEGTSTDGLLHSRRNDRAGIRVSSRNYSSEITIQIKPNDHWGSCHTEHDEGHVKIGNYKRKLDMTKGLYLEMYRSDSGERYNLHYIATNIYMD